MATFPDITIPGDTEYADLLNKLQRFFTSARKFWLAINTNNDVTIAMAGKGIIMTNEAGTVTKRVRLNETGDGLIYEDE
jgi:hypothetical protein